MSDSELIKLTIFVPVTVLVSKMSSSLVLVAIAWCVTSKPIIINFTPEFNTIFTASGSTKKLNSATGVVFPKPAPPPIKIICSILDDNFGSWDSTLPILVIGPSTQIVIFSSLFNRRLVM